MSSTGGRLHYRDYSGEFAAERRVRRVLLGVYGEHEVVAVGPALVSGRLHLRANPTATAYGRDVRLGDETVEDVDAECRSLGPSVLPALVVEVDASRRLRVRAHAGYEAAWGPGLDDVGGELPEGARWEDEAPRAGWSGARAGLGVALRLGGERRASAAVGLGPSLRRGRDSPALGLDASGPSSWRGGAGRRRPRQRGRAGRARRRAGPA